MTAVGRLVLASGALGLVCALIVGCLDMIERFEPDVGPPVRNLCINEDSDPDTDVSFRADVVAIFLDVNVACDECHDPQAETPLGVELSGLDLTSYSAMRRGGTVTGADIVIDGRPCDSGLVQKLSAGPPFGSRMPLDGPPFLTDEQRQRISDWIAEGARDN